MDNTQYDYDKLFMAYEECRSDNTAHVRKILELQQQNKELLDFVKRSHHVDGCAHRYQKDCDCGKFKLEAKYRSETNVNT